jgi:hypothetical protein
MHHKKKDEKEIPLSPLNQGKEDKRGGYVSLFELNTKITQTPNEDHGKTDLNPNPASPKSEQKKKR